MGPSFEVDHVSELCRLDHVSKIRSSAKRNKKNQGIYTELSGLDFEVIDCQSPEIVLI